MMAFKILPNDEVSRFLRPSDVMAKTFLDGQDHDPHLIPPMGRIDAKKNLQIEMSTIGHEISQEDEVLPEPSSKEAVNVYLRVKPKTEDESKYYSITSQSSDTTDTVDEKVDLDGGEEYKKDVVAETEVVSIESSHQIAFNAPPDSATYKNSINGKGKMTHRFSFTKILPSETDQAGLFNEIILPRLKNFLLEGRSQLIFSYGATSSGKTFTIQGDSGRPGILPRALDVLFNSFGDSYSQNVTYKPSGTNGLGTMVPREIERVAQEKKTIMEMGTEISLDGSQLSLGASSSCSSIPSQRVKDETKIELPQMGSQYAIWISFAEIYNENIYDLFEKLPEVKNNGEKPRRCPLKLADDKNGTVYIKGLKEVAVDNTDEAYQLLQIGRKNLKFAATRLNHHSSRSHCIFTIKVVKVNSNQSKCAVVNLLSFCDLAGSERIKKTLNTGERQKEAGNINTSLMVLGRVIKDIRHNQTVKNDKNRRVVPFRDSKLTRLFQPFFKSGLGQVSMIVNISQSAYLFDETLQVLKFSAIATKIKIEEFKDPVAVNHDPFIAPMPTNVGKKKTTDQSKRKTRFSILVEKNKQSVGGPSHYQGGGMGAFRGSIAWEDPQLCSTILQAPHANKKAMMNESVLEEEDEPEDLNDETVIENNRYDVNGLLKLIDSLKNDLIEAKQKNIRIEAETRQELCEEFNKMMVEIEEDWEKKLQEEKDRAAEYSEWRIGKMQEALDERRLNNQSNSNNVTVVENNEELEQKTKELEIVQAELDALKTLNSSVLVDNKKLKDLSESLQRSLEDSKEKETALKETVQGLKKELESTKLALENEDYEPRLKEMEGTIHSLQETNQGQKEKIEELKLLLDEAAQDYHRLSSNIETLQNEVKDKEFGLQELKGTENELRQLLTASNARNEEMELQVFEQAEQIERLKSELDNVTKEKETNWSQKMASEQQLTGLNDEIENLRSEKKKWRSLAESRESEISALEKAEKNHLQSQMALEEKLQACQKNLKRYEDSNSEKDTSISTLQKALNAIKKEESAIEALEQELNRKSEELSSKNLKIESLQAKLAENEYDVQRVKDDKEKLMNHYDQQIKKLTEDLSLEKRETAKMRQLMHSTTPQKQQQQRVTNEVTMLREELEKKSELIKTLAAKVTTPKKPSNSESSENNEKKHAAELKKVKSCYEKLIDDYKKANDELLKHVPASAAKKVMSFKRIVEDSEAEDENTAPPAPILDKSSVEATPVQQEDKSRKRRMRKTKGQNSKVSTATTQVSFEDDSMVCNNEDSSVFEAESRPTKKPRRGERVSRARPNKQYKSSATEEEIQDTSAASTAATTSILSDTSNIKVKEEEEEDVATAWKTPATSKKRKLFSQTPRPDIITPQPDESDHDTPRSIVKRQLRSRNIKIKK